MSNLCTPASGQRITRFTAFAFQILSLYNRGVCKRKITILFKELYGGKILHTFISKITEAVLEEVHNMYLPPSKENATSSIRAGEINFFNQYI